MKNTLILLSALALAITSGCAGGNSNADCQRTADLTAMCLPGFDTVAFVDSCTAGNDEIELNISCLDCSESAADPCAAPQGECATECGN